MNVDYSDFEDCRCYQFIPIKKSQFEYCVIGKYNDLNCEQFIASYMDIEYRKSWDKYTLTLENISGIYLRSNEFINWIFHNPLPLKAPNQYVYHRKLIKDKEKSYMAVVNW